MRKIYFFFLSTILFFCSAQTTLNQPETISRTVQDPQAVILSPGFSAVYTISNPFIAKIGSSTGNNPLDSNGNNSTDGLIKIDHLNASCPIFPLNVQGSFIAPSNTLLDNNNIILEIRAASSPTTVVGTVSNPSVSGTDFYFDIDQNKFPSTIVDKKFVFVVKATFKENNSSVISTVSSQINSTPDVNLNGCYVCNSCGYIKITLPGSCHGGQQGDGYCEFQQDVNFSSVLGFTTGTYKISNVQATYPNRNDVSIYNSGNTISINTPSSCSIRWDWDGFSSPAPTDMTADVEYTDSDGNKSTSHLYIMPQSYN